MRTPSPTQSLRGVDAIARYRCWFAICIQALVDKPRQPKVLVVFFSRTGTTRRLAEHIVRAVGADVEELKEAKSRRGLLGWLRSGYEGTYRISANILPLKRNPRDYDLVFIGSPTWNRALSSPVRRFLQQYADDLPRVALFATCQGRGASDVNAQMAGMLKQPPLATLAMLEADVKRSPSVQVGELTEAALCEWERLEPALQPQLRTIG